MKNTSPVSETSTDLPPSPTLAASLAALDDFRVIHPKEVVYVLRQLAHQKDPLSISFGRSGSRIITRILAVDETTGSFFYDYSGSDAENQQHQESGENLFSSLQSGAHTQFVCGHPEPQLYDGLPAFKSQLPESLYRIQRREHFRVETPTNNPYICTATLPDQRRMSFYIVDLSPSGVRLRSTDASIGELAIAMNLTDATFDFHDLGKMTLDIQITFIHNSQTFNDPVYHFGCRFLTVPKDQEANLQRVITQLELRLNRS